MNQRQQIEYFRKRIVAAGTLPVRNSTVRLALRTFSRKFIAISREDMGIHHAKADHENGYFPNAFCDSHGSRFHWDMRRFLLALGTMVIIDLVSTHDMASSGVKKGFTPNPSQRKQKPLRGIPRSH
jgi:hypothetical protein